jgi:putative transposase
MAHAAARFSAVADRVRPFSALEFAGCLGASAGRVEPTTSHPGKKRAAPSYGIVDSQSTKTVAASEEIGIDGGKKVKGRKRHIVVDTLGHLLHVAVHAANVHDTKAAPSVLERAAEKHPGIKAFSADAGYRGTTVDFVEQHLGLACHISTKIKDTFAVLPKRWIVERTFAWLGNFRRLAKDVEILTGTAENMIRIAMLKITLAKLR